MRSGHTGLVFLPGHSLVAGHSCRPFGCGLRPLCSPAHRSLSEARGRLPAVINLISRGKRKAKWFYTSVSIKRRRNKARLRRLHVSKEKMYFILFSCPIHLPHLPTHHGPLNLPSGLICFSCTPRQKGRWPFYSFSMRKPRC